MAKDKPWMMRTYAGHSSATASNELFRRNLEKGQTGLSVAFDLPTQTGYDPDAELARGEVGKVGVPISHIGDMHKLLDGIPLDRMNTSMTINATAMYLLAMYVAVAEENGIEPAALSGTTQNDIIKEYLSRGTYAFPPAPSLRLITDMIAYTVNDIPKWNPINICSYHLQEAGATPVQEIAYAMATAIAVLDAVRDSGQVPAERFGEVVGADLVLRQRRRAVRRGDVQDARLRPAVGRAHPRALRRHRRQAAQVPLRRAGQLAGPDRGPAGEQRPADRAGDARRDAVEGRPGPRRSSSRRGTRPSACRGRGTSSGRCGCSRCWPTSPTCWSTPTCSRVGGRGREDRIARCGAREELERVQAMGGAVAAVESGYMKSALVGAHAAQARSGRVRRGRRDRRQHVHLHRAQPAAGRPRHRDPGHRPARRAGRGRRRAEWRAGRDEARATAARAALAEARERHRRA